MNRKLFIGGLSWNTTDTILHQTFSPFGQVMAAKVIMDRETGKSRGFGFIEFETDESAKAAQKALHGSVLDGRTIRVELSESTGTRGSGGTGGTGGARTRDNNNRHHFQGGSQHDGDRGNTSHDNTSRAAYGHTSRTQPEHPGENFAREETKLPGNQAPQVSKTFFYVEDDDDNRGNC